jgi:hypothetical protein
VNGVPLGHRKVAGGCGEMYQVVCHVHECPAGRASAKDTLGVGSAHPGATTRGVAKRVAIAIVLAALLLGLYNDFTIKGRMADSFAARSGLQVDHCTRFTNLELQGKNYFACTVKRPGRAAVVYKVNVKGRCWTEARLRLHGCLPRFDLGAAGR